ncbi:hypothetical protein LR48_Vigan205s002900 [Vigna angularis]|uniref:Uncharacterized protein n=1 Tax=Phaseolus angularis TaxID=3914 RepID=A0A0L9T5P0_PHAAN|nr:hypothetical protein LR48_Vigan205s002900 [Vigna angularis]
MVSLSTTTPFLPFTAQNASTRIPPPNTFRYTNHRHRDHRKVVCACIAPLQNFKSQDSSPVNFNVKEGDRARRFMVVLWMLFGFFWVGFLLGISAKSKSIRFFSDINLLSSSGNKILQLRVPFQL